MNARHQRKASHGQHPMVQSLFPEFDKGTDEERLGNLRRWAARVHPGRQFPIREIARITGISVHKLYYAQEKALDQIATSLMEIKHEYTRPTEGRQDG